MVKIYGKILIAIDGSEMSKTVFEKGMEMVRAFESQVAIVAVVDTTVTSTFSTGIDESDALLTESELELLKNNEKMMKNFVNELIGNKDIHSEIRYGIPHKEISDYAKEWNADLLVVGSHSKDGGLSEFLFGSTAKKLVKEASCDVLLVKTNETKGGKKQ